MREVASRGEAGGVVGGASSGLFNVALLLVRVAQT